MSGGCLHTATGESFAGSELSAASHGNMVGGGVSFGLLAYASGSVSHTVTTRPTATRTVRLPTPTVVPGACDETQCTWSPLRGPLDPLAAQPAQPATSTPTATATRRVFTQIQTPPSAVGFHRLLGTRSDDTFLTRKQRDREERRRIRSRSEGPNPAPEGRSAMPREAIGSGSRCFGSKGSVRCSPTPVRRSASRRSALAGHGFVPFRDRVASSDAR